MVKKRSANGGCLGSKRRRRTWNPAKSVGELEIGVITNDVRMGEPGHKRLWSSIAEYIGYGGELGELKHLSTQRKRNQLRFSK
jgi:hypothetical protein